MTYYDLNMNSKKITNCQDPSAAQDVATKNYVDGRTGTSLVSATLNAIQGAVSGSLLATATSITLTAGTWLVQARLACIININSDGAKCFIWNITTSSVVANSSGVPSSIFVNAGTTDLASALTIITVSSNTQLCPGADRNGFSQLECVNTNVVGGPVQLISAVRVA